MINPRLLELAKRLKNEDLPKKEPPKPDAEPPAFEPPQVNESFILAFNDRDKELIAKSNELSQGTKAEIPTGDLSDGQEVPNMHILKRLALITAIYKNRQLQSHGLWPITPLQSEQLLKEGKLPKPGDYWEDLALILYDRSSEGKNPNEAKALYESLKQHRTDLSLSESDLEARLLIVNAGIEKDAGMPHGVKPIVLPGITRAYPHEALKRTGQDHAFEYGLEHGIPSADSLGSGSRTLYMPSSNENIGLRVLYRNRNLDLNARNENLVNSNADGRVNFARQGAQKN